MSALINWAACKKYALDRAAATRAQGFSRASAECVPWLDSVVREAIDRWVHGHPSKGKTLYPPVRGGTKEST